MRCPESVQVVSPQPTVDADAVVCPACGDLLDADTLEFLQSDRLDPDEPHYREPSRRGWASTY